MKTNIQTKNSFNWTHFYMEFANRLLLYKDNRPGLLELIKKVFDDLEIRYPFIDNGNPMDDICPFTVFGCFNKGISNENRMGLMDGIGRELGVKAPIPTEFDGIPVLNNMKAWFFGYKADRQPDDISNLWDVFEAAIIFADKSSEVSKAVFITCYDKVRKQQGIKWNLTMALYWIRPFFYLNLDERNRSYLAEADSPYMANITKVSNLKQLPSAKTYLELIAVCKDIFQKNDSPHHSFPELSHAAWLTSTSTNQNKKRSTASFLKWFAPIINALKTIGGTATPEQVRSQIIDDLSLSDEIVNETRGKTSTKKFDNEIAFARNYLTYEGYIDKSVRGVWKLTNKGFTDPMNEEIAGEIFLKWVDILKERRENSNSSPDVQDKNEKRYWIYAPGNNSSKWDEFYSQKIMGIGWDEMGDLNQYPTKDAMKTKMKELYGEDYSYKNSAHATWQFAHEIKPGDVVYVKKGLYKIIGRGIVESDYYYDTNRDEFKHLHNINWTHNGEWEHPGQAVLKVLTDISPYTDYVQKLENAFVNDDTVDIIEEEKEVVYEPYTEDDFLSEVFMSEESYNTLANLLKAKKNLILQGAPGVGKTFVAKRLAYSIMGVKDTSRVMIIQFHQSYSYEDFIMGFRPSKDGFELKAGPFYQFCKTAQDDNEQDYFFIIDEINRGNLSKIFGELLMLIENEKRGEKLRLLYSNELFSVPKNVHIIGMMNTADRSLAMIDYALRRRFAFFEIEPAFNSDGFKAIMLEANNQKYNALIEQIQALNEYISKDEALGHGFRIGHSYLCTNKEINDGWLNSVIHYEILPLLNEYWFDEKSKIEQWTIRLCGALND